MKAPRPCIVAGCTEYATVGSRCVDHAASYEAKRRQNPNTGRRSGTSEWRRIRARVLIRDGNRCVRCQARGDLMIHHVDGEPRNNALSNLQALCYTCHYEADRAIRESRKGPYR